MFGLSQVTDGGVHLINGTVHGKTGDRPAHAFVCGSAASSTLLLVNFGFERGTFGSGGWAFEIPTATGYENGPGGFLCA